jgi:hypothetical protein
MPFRPLVVNTASKPAFESNHQQLEDWCFLEERHMNAVL